MQKKKKGRYSFLYRFIFRVGFFCAAVWALLTYVIAPFRMTGNNMYSNVKDGDLCIFYRLAEISNGDAVLYEDGSGKKHVGRIVAFPGQEVDFAEEGGYLINGYSPSELIPYETHKSEKSMIKFPLLLNDDEYFVLNDYRSETKDSRELGAVKKEQIIGSLVFIFRRRGL